MFWSLEHTENKNLIVGFHALNLLVKYFSNESDIMQLAASAFSPISVRFLSVFERFTQIFQCFFLVFLVLNGYVTCQIIAIRTHIHSHTAVKSLLQIHTAKAVSHHVTHPNTCSVITQKPARLSSEFNHLKIGEENRINLHN